MFAPTVPTLKKPKWKNMNLQIQPTNLEVNYAAYRRRQWHPTPVLLPGKSHGWRSLVGCSPWGRWELDTTQWLHFHFSLSCTEEGNGNPLQCSCLQNPRDGGAWWAAVYGAAQSRTWLKQLSSSSNPQPRDQTWVSCASCIGRQIFFTTSTTWEAPDKVSLPFFSVSAHGIICF